jgi:hypothetical protein
MFDISVIIQIFIFFQTAPEFNVVMCHELQNSIHSLTISEDLNKIFIGTKSGNIYSCNYSVSQEKMI